MRANLKQATRALGWRLRYFRASFGARRASRRILDGAVPRHILVVCHGNIYRSPLVASVLSRRLDDVCKVRSAGFHPVGGRPTPTEQVAFCSRLGVDLAAHRSSVVTPDNIAWADVIVLMDRHNWQRLIECGADADKLIWLGTLDGGREVQDPYGLASGEAAQIMLQVHRCSEALAEAILARHRSVAAG